MKPRVEKVVATTVDKQPKAVVLSLDCIGKSFGELKKKILMPGPIKSESLWLRPRQQYFFFLIPPVNSKMQSKLRTSDLGRLDYCENRRGVRSERSVMG